MARAPVLPKQAGTQATQLSGAVGKAARDANDSPFLGGIAIKDIAIGATSSVVVTHALKRIPSGWLLTDITGNPLSQLARFVWDDRTITLTNFGTNNIVVSVWVY